MEDVLRVAQTQYRAPSAGPVSNIMEISSEPLLEKTETVEIGAVPESDQQFVLNVSECSFRGDKRLVS
ncbi:MAG: hypothetical protein PHQ19_08275 [Candidatus Krumholzibacteria bacterium]|nr:hypothetical protein [Candidatus Krumholzibacteria bacterium]